MAPNTRTSGSKFSTWKSREESCEISNGQLARRLMRSQNKVLKYSDLLKVNISTMFYVIKHNLLSLWLAKSWDSEEMLQHFHIIYLSSRLPECYRNWAPFTLKAFLLFFFLEKKKRNKKLKINCGSETICFAIYTVFLLQTWHFSRQTITLLDRRYTVYHKLEGNLSPPWIVVYPKQNAQGFIWGLKLVS